MSRSLDANLIKKYHQDLVFNYAEYPTKDHWQNDFKFKDYQNAILEWFPKNQDKKIFFMCIYLSVNNYAGFALVANMITNDYKKVSSYLEYLHKEIDILFNF